MSQHYGPTDDRESIATIHRAIAEGMTMIDTATSYGGGANERLIGRALAGRRDDVVLATKFGIVRTADGSVGLDGRPAYARACCERSLRRLGTDHVDLYYLHRVDPVVPVEESIGAMAELAAEGKIRHLGISEVGVDALRRAHATHPITALQAEWSLWSRDIEDAVLPAARALGIGVVAYRPLGQGFLTGAVRSRDSLSAPDDVRPGQPRFQAGNLRHNEAQLRRVRTLAERVGITPAQLALAWLLAQGDDVVPIPGTKCPDRATENAAAAVVELSDEDLAELDGLIAPGSWRGERQTFASYATVQPER
jgi:aryl-alcohol dehydrogenase-like predicted oxidoreductase